MNSAFSGEGKQHAEEIQVMWNPLIDTRDWQREKSDQDDGSARFASTRELMMPNLKISESRLWAARTRAAMGVWLGWLAAVRSLQDSGVWTSSPPKTGKRLLLTGGRTQGRRGGTTTLL